MPEFLGQEYIYMKNEPKAVLWNVDSGEIYARRYAHQRRKLKPVTFK